jgi:CxxC-x17-CxxC domain-containing protein
MDFFDKELTCADCGANFLFTAGEQLYYHTREFQNVPKHCKQCRVRRAIVFRKPVYPAHPEIRTTCAECGSKTTVPFKPRLGKPVLCRSCFQKKAAAS